jgi:hypothetical protein
MSKKTENWQIIGYLPTGETVYCSSERKYAKGMDDKHLIEMTTEELHLIMPEKE